MKPSRPWARSLSAVVLLSLTGCGAVRNPNAVYRNGGADSLLPRPPPPPPPETSAPPRKSSTARNPRSTLRSFPGSPERPSPTASCSRTRSTPATTTHPHPSTEPARLRFAIFAPMSVGPVRSVVVRPSPPDGRRGGPRARSAWDNGRAGPCGPDDRSRTRSYAGRR